MNILKSPLGRLRILSLVEALSYLTLLFIAMPMKYIWGQPEMVRVVGMAHGVLFCIFCLVLLQAWIAAEWKIKVPTLIFIASLIPFAPILVERWLKKEEAKFDQLETA
ncbi:DUF3817 domain-containing protein [Persicirhabdus sediminis]|uniref:DUF3817 domain-containing protein n=1 Tax=Persicirhabdus sediminis TaxID=454144 RepID=A0A8J7MD98_9BACT|nr:DUF3817 domain-containing protein [Persicirhabdus sediminis]MBK1790462.1 DUF3817 domain-containing protein [Persicirhabdus sediminis]